MIANTVARSRIPKPNYISVISKAHSSSIRHIAPQEVFWPKDAAVFVIPGRLVSGGQAMHKDYALQSISACCAYF
jgi:hypothetical protein